MSLVFESYDGYVGGYTSNFTDTFSEHMSTTFNADGYNYVIHWYCEVQIRANSSFAEIRIHLDNTTELALGSIYNAFYTDPWLSIDGTIRQTFTPGTRQIDMDFRNFDNTTEIRVRRGRIMVLFESV
jgi:hypothetical protein